MAADGAYQGARGAFSEEAARALLGPDARLTPCRTLADVFSALVSGRVAMAVVPLTNSLVGPVPDAAELIAWHHARVVGEHNHPIDQAVIAAPGVGLESITRVWSHPVALAQCRRWFARHPGAAALPAFDTAGAVADVLRRGARHEAAIASRRAADVYGGVVLEERVQDHPDNFTRFVLVSR